MLMDIQQLTTLAARCTGKNVERTQPIAQSGSHRVYVRLFLNDGTTLMGAYNDDIKENEAFFAFTDFFGKEHLNVPKVLAISGDRMHYIQNDLGNETLFSYLTRRKTETGTIPDDVIDYFKKVLQQLPLIQLCGKKNFDFSVCYPSPAFDRHSIQWDLNYFKYYFLKLAYIPFDELHLENDFNTLIESLLEADQDYFLYRDFQSRNIMLKDGDVYFIDYQGGRKGALQYDLASLLYQAKAGLPDPLREELLDFYLDELTKHLTIDRQQFRKHYYLYVLVRQLQVLGAYGYRGYYEKKAHFLQSIPPAVENIRTLMDKGLISVELPELTKALRAITAIDWTARTQPPAAEEGKLTVEVRSFSFKKGIPEDLSGNGGGFVFDCRALPNPGREPQYRSMTGLDRPVIEYLEKYPEVEAFKQHLFAIADMSVDNYLERKFTHLSISCGCTGGQHRSVYFAQSVADHLRAKYPDVNVVLVHREQGSGDSD